MTWFKFLYGFEETGYRGFILSYGLVTTFYVGPVLSGTVTTITSFGEVGVSTFVGRLSCLPTVLVSRFFYLRVRDVFIFVVFNGINCMHNEQAILESLFLSTYRSRQAFP